MRFVIACLVALGFAIGSATVAVPAAAGDAGFVVALQQPPTGELNVDINTDGGGGGAWYTSPLWIAIGVIGLLVLILIIVMAARGGGTTVVRD